MTSVYFTSISLLTITLLSGCAEILQLPGKQVAPIETSQAQCIENQNIQEQNLTMLGDQVVDLSDSLTLLSLQLDETNTASAQVGELNSNLALLFDKLSESDESPPSIEDLALDCSVSSNTNNPAFDKLIIGREEDVWLQDLQLALPARIDTGAETASIDARNIELFERDGNTWVRFDILHPETEEPLQLERILKRQVSIVQSNTVEAERRPVIELGIALGTVRQLAEFTLSDRSHLNHQILIGRNILRDVMIVDVSQSNIAPYVTPVPVLAEEAQ